MSAPVYGNHQVDELVKQLQTIQQMKREYVRISTETQVQIRSNAFGLPTMVDIAWIAQELRKTAEQMEKEASKLEKLAATTCGAVWTAMATSDPETPEKVTGFIATGSPDASLAANIPSRKTERERYDTLLGSLGCPTELMNTEVLRIHWPAFIEYVDARAQNGLGLPPGITSSYSQYVLRNLKVRHGVKIEGL